MRVLNIGVCKGRHAYKRVGVSVFIYLQKSEEYNIDK